MTASTGSSTVGTFFGDMFAVSTSAKTVYFLESDAWFHSLT
jgi:hypothetical protein